MLQKNCTKQQHQNNYINIYIHRKYETTTNIQIAKTHNTKL